MQVSLLSTERTVHWFTVSVHEEAPLNRVTTGEGPSKAVETQTTPPPSHHMRHTSFYHGHNPSNFINTIPHATSVSAVKYFYRAATEK